MKKVTHKQLLKKIKELQTSGYKTLTICAEDFHISTGILKKLKDAGFNISLSLEKYTDNLVFIWD